MKQYVTDIIGDDYLQWKPGEKVLIKTPTGSGKTTFVLKSLLTHAVQCKKHVIYYCNRTVLHDQFSVISEERIRSMYQSGSPVTADEALSYLHIFTYQSIEQKEVRPAMYVKDAFNNEELPLWADDILYYIFDEAHYFLSDSSINSNTNFWIDAEYGRYFDTQKNISVYLTATPEPLYVFLSCSKLLNELKMEDFHNQCIKFRTGKKRQEKHVEIILSTLVKICKQEDIPMEFPSLEDLSTYVKYHFDSFLRDYYSRIDHAISTQAGLDHVYPKQADEISPQEYYAYVKPLYFKEYTDLIDEIKGRNEEKWLIFVDDEDNGLEFAHALEKAGITQVGFISRKRINKLKDVKKIYKSIVEDECYPQQVLISTSVLDCGINIHDSQVKNVVLSSISKSSFQQMLGRKRVDEGEEVRVFIKMYPHQTIHNRYNQCFTNLRMINLFSLKNAESPIRYDPNNPDYRSGIAFDSYQYGSSLTEREFTQLNNSMKASNTWQWYVKPQKKEVAPHKYHNHIVSRSEPVRNTGNNYRELEFSKTAFLHLLMQMHEYEKSFQKYRSYDNPIITELFFYMQSWLSDLQKNDTGYNYFNIFGGPYNRAEEIMLDLKDRGITNLTFNVERTDIFFLKHQLEWLGKEYNEENWFRKPTERLKDYLESNLYNQYIDPKTFSQDCIDLLKALPQLPDAIKRDISRYEHTDRNIKRKKLEACFKELNLHYKIHSRQKQINGNRQIYWYLSHDPLLALLKE